MSTDERERVIADQWWRWLTDEQNARIVEQMLRQRVVRREEGSKSGG